MSEQMKPEVHLEISSGVFRIPTDTVTYNIKVISSGESIANTVVNQIVATEMRGQASQRVEPSPDLVEPVVDDFYAQAYRYFTDKVCLLAEHRSQSEAKSDDERITGPAEDCLSRVDSVLLSVDQGLSEMRLGFVGQEETSIVPAGSGTEKSAMIEGVLEVGEDISKVKKIIAELMISPPKDSHEVVASTPAPPATKTRYLFDIDVVFQTMYELCTNETVKTHSQDARAKAATLFNQDTFLDFLSEKISGYEEDDGFFLVPVSDVLVGLVAACADKTVINLLKNMNKKQADIFLDQFLPLEVPPTEEIASQEESLPQVDAGGEPDAVADEPESGGLVEVSSLLNKIIANIDQLSVQIASPCDEKSEAVSGKNNEDLLPQLDDLLAKVRAIGDDTKQTMSEIEKDSSQQVLGQDPDELITGLLDIGRSMVDCLQQKENQSDLIFSDITLAGSVPDIMKDIANSDEGQGENLAEEDFSLSTSQESPDLHDEMLDFSEEILTGDIEPDEEDDFGEASQDDIDKLLEDMNG